MPAKPKRADQRQDNRARRAPLAVVEGSGASRPSLPSGRRWLKRTKDAWATFWDLSIAAAVEPDDLAGVVRMFDMRDQYEKAMARYDKSPYVEGSQGQPRANPALDDALKLDRQITAHEDRLGLSPKARFNLQMAFGQAQLTAADLNRMARESDADSDSGEVIDAELASEWEEAN